MAKDLSLRAPVQLAVAENASTPTGALGAEIWSTTANKKLVWDGSKWADAMGSGGGGGSGDVVGPTTSVANTVPVFSDTTGNLIGNSALSVSSVIEAPTAFTNLSLGADETQPRSVVTSTLMARNSIGEDAFSEAGNGHQLVREELTLDSQSSLATSSTGARAGNLNVEGVAARSENFSAATGTGVEPDFSNVSAYSAFVAEGHRGAAQIESECRSSYNETDIPGSFVETVLKVQAGYRQIRIAAGEYGDPLNLSNAETTVLSTHSLGIHVDGQMHTVFGEGGWLGLGVGSDPGIAGQVLTSGGAGQPVSWATPAGGGSGDVVGPSSSVNNRVVTFSGTTGKQIQEATFFDIPDISNPVAPAAGNLRIFARAQAGRMLPAFVGPSGLDSNLQPALFRNSIYMWLPGTATTTAINFATNWTARNSGTSAAQAHPTKASTNALTSMNRATFSTGTTATGTSGIQSGQSVAWRGNAAGLGGFFYFSRFAVETFRSDIRLFVGLSARNATLAGEPSAQNNSVGLCKDAADTDWHILTRNGSTATKTPLQVPLAVAAGTILDFLMFAPPNGSDITFRLVNAVTGDVYADGQVVTATLPVSTSFMFAHASIMSTTGTTAALLALNRIYVECDL